MGKKKKNPPKWTAVYPAGTQVGDEECKFFKALGRNPKFQWRSTAALVKESGLSRKRVEEIIQKYFKLGMVFQSPKNEDHWGYWERCPEMLPDVDESIAQNDQNDRIKKTSASVAVNWGAAPTTMSQALSFAEDVYDKTEKARDRVAKYMMDAITLHRKEQQKRQPHHFVDLSATMHRPDRYKEYDKLCAEKKKYQVDQLIADLKKFGLHCCKGSDLEAPAEEKKYRKGWNTPFVPLQ